MKETTRLLVAAIAMAAGPAAVCAQSTSHVFTGRVVHEGSAPISGAVVVTSAGGQAITRADGTFALAAEVPGEAGSVQVSAFAGASLGASARIAAVPSTSAVAVGDLVLAATSCAPSWLPTFGGLPGVDNTVYAFAVFDDGSGPALYVGGTFHVAGGVAADNVARWDGTRWSAVGNGVNQIVYALAVFDDGSGPALYAGGGFLSFPGIPGHYLFKWDGTNWSDIPSQLDGRVLALTTFDDGTGPALYAGGLFGKAGGNPANHVAKWDGTSWSPLGSGFAHPVYALAAFDDGSGPALYVGGGSGGFTSDNVGRWNGASWEALGDGLDGFVLAFAVYDDGSGPALHAGGSFLKSGPLTANGIVKWTGTSWAVLGSGVVGSVSGLAVFDDGSGPELFACGFSRLIYPGMKTDLAKWNGSRWQNVGGFDYAPRVIAGFTGSQGSGLYAGGRFWTAGGGGVPALSIARWNGFHWSSLTNGMNGGVSAFAVYDDGSGPALFAGGWFTAASGKSVECIAKWNGTDWTSLGGAMSSGISTLAVFDDGTGPALYAAGSIANPGLVSNYLAQWDGSRWSALGSEVNGGIGALVVFDDGTGSALYAGGTFTMAGTTATNRIAKWDGSTWNALGSGLTSSSGICTVYALTTFDDGTGTALYAAGDFTTAGGTPANRIAKWDGSTWTPLGTGIDVPASKVFALATFDDGTGAALYAGGLFTSAGGIPVSNIAKWDGTRWSPVGGGTDGGVGELTVIDDGTQPALYVGGAFDHVGSQVAHGIAKWNGAIWEPIGTGVGGVANTWSVAAIAFTDDGNGSALFIGGSFTTSPGGDSYVAKWGCPPTAGARTFGASAPGCTGALAIGVTSSPRVGNSAFAITCTQAPPSAPGALVFGNALNPPLALLGTRVWVNPVLALSITSEASGSARVALPIREDPSLAGAQIDAQCFWIGPASPPPCPPLGVSASNALALTIQP